MALDAQENPRWSQRRFFHKPRSFSSASSYTGSHICWVRSWLSALRQINPEHWQPLPGQWHLQWPQTSVCQAQTLSVWVFCWRVLVQNRSLPALAQTQQWGSIAITHSSISSSAVCCFTGIKGQDADWILPCHFCVLFSVLLQIRVFFPPSCHFYVYPVQGIFRELAADTNEHVRDACEMWCFFGCVWFGFFCGFHIF